MLPRSAFAGVLLCLSAAGLRAEVLPTLPLRELTIRADAVVLAAPADPAQPGRVRVLELLKGAAPRPGAEFEVGGLDACVRPKEQPEWDRVDAALLFLRATGEGRFELVESGVRLHTRDRKVWWPVQLHNPGNYHMHPQPEALVRWDAVVLRVRGDAAEAARLQAAAELVDVTRRDRALLDWVGRHRNEFSDGREMPWLELSPAVRNLGPEDGGRTDLDVYGWGDLQLVPFARVLQGQVPADCWRAVNLYAELTRGTTPPGAAAAFARRDGRAWLLAAAGNGGELDGNRARALRLLGDLAIDEPAAMDSAERAALLDGLLPLLKDADPMRRGLAARAVQRTVGTDAAAVDRAFKDLGAAFKAEKPGPARNLLAEALYTLVGPQRWTALSGRPNGSMAVLRDLTLRDDKLFFWVTLKTEATPTVTEKPTLFLERLDAKDAVTEAKSIPLALPASTWRGGPLYVEVRHDQLKAGAWRLRVSGVDGKDKRPWESEPRLVRIDEATAAKRPQRSPSLLNRWLRANSGVVTPAMNPNEKPKRTVTLDGEPF